MEDSINIALRLTNAVRNAMAGDSFTFAPADYMDRIDFRFLPRKKSIFGGYSTTLAESWYNHLEDSGLTQIYADFDYYSEKPPVIYCEFTDGRITEFSVICAEKKAGHLMSDVFPNQVDGVPVVT